MNISNLFNDFFNELMNRSLFLTEDSVRYIFFACMLKQDPQLNNYILELPYAQITAGSGNNLFADWKKLSPNRYGKQDQELDLFYSDKSCIYCFEFKFHRVQKYLSSKAKTSQAGGLFNDLHRLQLIHSIAQNGLPVRRFLVYVTDSLMHKYLGSPSKKEMRKSYRCNLKAFYTLPISSGMRLSVQDSGSTFGKSAYHSIDKSARPMITNIVNRCSNDFFGVHCPSLSNGELHIRGYEVVDILSAGSNCIDDYSDRWDDNYETMNEILDCGQESSLELSASVRNPL